MWDSILNGLKNLDIKDYGALLSGWGQAYGAFEQGKMADKYAKLQLKDYEDEKKRKKNTQNKLNSAYAQLPLTSY